MKRDGDKASIQVALASGTVLQVATALDAMVAEISDLVLERAELKGALRLAIQGRLLKPAQTLAAAGVRHGDTLSAVVVPRFRLFSTDSAFAVLKADGSVVAWGKGDAGGYIPDEIEADLAGDVLEVFANNSSFAAMKTDGSVVVWGAAETGGEVPVAKRELLKTGVKQVFATFRAFAVLKEDGSVVCWGLSESGGDASRVSEQLRSGVVDLRAAGRSFAALKEDGSVLSWGAVDSRGVQHELQGCCRLFANREAFAALKTGGKLITWGDPDRGGESSAVRGKLERDVEEVFASQYSRAFAALKTNGELVIWGGTGLDHSGAGGQFGGDAKAVSEQLQSGVKEVFCNTRAFAALKSNGDVVTWGHPRYGGDCANVQEELRNVRTIFPNPRLFAALRSDGSLITWGRASSGGDSSTVKAQLRSGVQSAVANKYTWSGCLYDGCDDFAFAALKTGGEVVTWGPLARGGGGNEEVKEQLQSGVLEICATSSAFAAVKLHDVVTWGDISMPRDVRAKLLDEAPKGTGKLTSKGRFMLDAGKGKGEFGPKGPWKGTTGAFMDAAWKGKGKVGMRELSEDDRLGARARSRTPANRSSKLE